MSPSQRSRTQPEVCSRHMVIFTSCPKRPQTLYPHHSPAALIQQPSPFPPSFAPPSIRPKAYLSPSLPSPDTPPSSAPTTSHFNAAEFHALFKYYDFEASTNELGLTIWIEKIKGIFEFFRSPKKGDRPRSATNTSYQWILISAFEPGIDR